MGVSENKAAARRFMEVVLGTGDWQGAENLLDPAVVMVHPSSPEPIRGFEAMKQMLSGFRAAFPDLTITVEEVVGEGDKVAVRWTFRGTHTADLFGMPPTGAHGEMPGVSWFTFAGGKVVEDRVFEDTLGLMRQLGTAPV